MSDSESGIGGCQVTGGERTGVYQSTGVLPVKQDETALELC